MFKFLALGLLLLSISCNSDKSQSKDLLAIANTPAIATTYETTPFTMSLHPNHPYELKMNMSELGKDTYELELMMLLFDGAHFVSPNAVRDFSGKFTVHLDDSEAIETISDLIETPRSVEEDDPHPFVRGKVNWVREDTKYQLKLKRKADENFDIKGFIQFTIEPRCTLEKIPIIIKYEEGEMRVELFGC